MITTCKSCGAAMPVYTPMEYRAQSAALLRASTAVYVPVDSIRDREDVPADVFDAFERVAVDLEEHSRALRAEAFRLEQLQGAAV